jgi:hypothetical protein
MMSLIKVIKGQTIRKVMGGGGGGGGKTKKKIIPREKLGGKIFPGIVQKKVFAGKIGL